jgi:hypothetical protein
MILTVPDARLAVAEYRDLMNQGHIAATNALLTDDFFAVFSLGKPGEFETYHADQYRRGNLEVEKYYEGKNPHWEYTDLSWGMRDETEFVISSAIDFTLNGELIMKALVMEIYRADGGSWKLARQYMEKYRPDDYKR